MAVKHSKQSRRLWTSLLVSGLFFLVGFLLWRRMSPPQVIRSVFRAEGYSDRFIDYWIAISQHETAGWTSRVYREGNNLFGMTRASKNTLAIGALDYGEHQAIYKSIRDSAKDQILYLNVRFHYPREFGSLKDLIDYMKSKGYFGDSVSNYYSAVSRWYAQDQSHSA